jgi:hypothetical protein
MVDSPDYRCRRWSTLIWCCSGGFMTAIDVGRRYPVWRQICMGYASKANLKHPWSIFNVHYPVILFYLFIYFLCEQSDPHAEAGRFDQRLFY